MYLMLVAETAIWLCEKHLDLRVVLFVGENNEKMQSMVSADKTGNREHFCQGYYSSI